MNELPSEAEEVLRFWFRELAPGQWFEGSKALDLVVAERFSALLSRARSGELDGWAQTPRGRLALVIVLDQVPRHIFRGRAEAFGSDAKAQALTVEAIESGLDEQLNFAERHFLYMPLMHSEDMAMQALSVSMFERLRDFAEYVLEFARGHRDTIERFGRFPARNDSLGRASSPEERAFLASESNRGRAPDQT